MAVKPILGALFIVVVMSLIVIYYFMPFTEVEFSINQGNYNFSIAGENVQDMQFYNNMRFESNHISYKIQDCSIKKNEDMRDAFNALEEVSILDFYPVVADENLLVTCDEKARFEKGMFIAGEGGPDKIVKSGKYNVIYHGKVLLYRDSQCADPNVAIHELLHALGFTHSDNPNNIMHNFTKCGQTIGEEIPDAIDELYFVPSHPDLIIENASAYLDGRYLNLNISVRNIGLGKSIGSKVDIKMGDSIVKEVDVDGLAVGSGQIITINNIRVIRLSIEDIEMIIEYQGVELDKTNNNVVLVIKK